MNVELNFVITFVSMWYFCWLGIIIQQLMQKIVSKYTVSFLREATTEDAASQKPYSFASDVENFPGC